jgi:septum formation protein
LHGADVGSILEEAHAFNDAQTTAIHVVLARAVNPVHVSAMPIVLASASPRRRVLLERAGLEFEVMVSPAEEIHDASLPPASLCEWNAALKAEAVAVLRPDATVIGSDTLVFLDGEPLGKPADLADAHRMLLRLAGRTHQVCTGVCVIFPGGTRRVFHDISEVTFLPLDDAAIHAYFARVDPLDKAGAYGIQEHGELIIHNIRGCADNVMGLPVALVVAVLREESDCRAGAHG